VSAGGECWFIVPKEIDDISKHVYSYMSLVTGGKTLAIPSMSVKKSVTPMISLGFASSSLRQDVTNTDPHTWRMI